MTAAENTSADRRGQRLQNVATVAGAVGGAALGASVGAVASGLYALRTRTSSPWGAARHGSLTGLVVGAAFGGFRGRLVGTLAALSQEAQSLAAQADANDDDASLPQARRG